VAKREVTLGAEDWVTVRDLIGMAPAPQQTGEQAKRVKLYLFIEAKAAQAIGEYTAHMTASQCRAVIEALETPGIPYRVGGLRDVWRIKEAFGWTPPKLDVYAEDDESDDDDEEGESVAERPRVTGPAIPVHKHDR